MSEIKKIEIEINKSYQYKTKKENAFCQRFFVTSYVKGLYFLVMCGKWKPTHIVNCANTGALPGIHIWISHQVSNPHGKTLWSGDMWLCDRQIGCLSF